MATNYFPDNYTPTYSPSQTFSYIDKYRRNLIAAISSKWNAILIDPPILTSAFNSWDSYGTVSRYITFDNKNINELNQIFSSVSIFMRDTWNNLRENDQNIIYCYASTVNRDSECTFIDSIITHDFYIEMGLAKEEKTDNIKQHCLDFIEIIKSINNLPEFSDIQNLEYDINQIGVINALELNKRYPSLSMSDAITQHVVNNGACIIVGVFKQLSSKRFTGGLPASDDYDACSVLFVYHEIINKVLPVIKISPRPSMEKIKNQLIIDLPFVLNTHVYNQTIFKSIDHYLPSIGIRIYFSNLMMINLKKYHLAEVVHSNWPEDFIIYTKKNKIFIM